MNLHLINKIMRWRQKPENVGVVHSVRLAREYALLQPTILDLYHDVKDCWPHQKCGYASFECLIILLCRPERNIETGFIRTWANLPKELYSAGLVFERFIMSPTWYDFTINGLIGIDYIQKNFNGACYSQIVNIVWERATELEGKKRRTIEPGDLFVKTNVNIYHKFQRVRRYGI